jgi:hypothetical protein
VDLPKWFKTFPNLASLSIELTRDHGRPTEGEPWYIARIEPLEIAEKGIFPPLENLSLSGYRLSEVELLFWKENFPWSGLKSLSMGPIHTPGFLTAITGCVKNLSSFTISAYNGSVDGQLPELVAFIMSFATLESLTVKGLPLSMGAVGYHSNLQRLILHSVENDKKERKILDADDIMYLDEQCPKLQFLEIDIRRKDEWVSLFKNIIPSVKTDPNPCL